MKLNNSQYKSSDIESKVFISLFYAPLNGQFPATAIPCNNLEQHQDREEKDLYMEQYHMSSFPIFLADLDQVIHG